MPQKEVKKKKKTSWKAGRAWKRKLETKKAGYFTDIIYLWQYSSRRSLPSHLVGSAGRGGGNGPVVKSGRASPMHPLYSMCTTEDL